MPFGKARAASAQDTVAMPPTTIFIVSYGRPIYLWMCLDSLFRQTKSAVRTVLVDNWHPDRQVDTVINAFVRRGFLDEVHRFQTNSAANIQAVYDRMLETAGPEHVVVDGDTVVTATATCWLAEMLRIFRAAPQIGMLGSLIDVGDFVPEAVCRDLESSGTCDVRFLAKLGSVERGFAADGIWSSTDRDYFYAEPPCPAPNPPGRLMMLSTDVMRETGLLPDHELAARFREQGLRPAITPKVVHRHLSLLNLFDYDDYNGAARDQFFELFQAWRRPAAASARWGNVRA